MEDTNVNLWSTTPDIKLDQNQIAKILKKSIDTFSVNWKPDNCEVVVSLTKTNTILAKIVCVTPFKSVRSGDWEIHIHSDDYKDGKVPSKVVKGTGLTNILVLFARKAGDLVIFDSEVQSPIGFVLLTAYQKKKLWGYVNAVNEDDYDKDLKMKIVVRTKVGDDNVEKNATFVVHCDDTDEAEIEMGDQRTEVQVSDILN